MTIQQDTRSLRRVAIERYLRTCSRIDRQHRQDARSILLLVLLMITVLCLAMLGVRLLPHYNAVTR